MKAAVLHQYDTSLTNQEFVTLEEVEEPHLEKSTDVIVRIGGAGVCRTDLHVIEGIWRQKVEVKLPYVMGHENAGWVEEVGKGVEGFKKGDAVICHPLISNCHALEARRGHDMHVDGSEFPGINTNGGYAELLRTGASSLIKLPQTLAPKDVAPQADAGLTAYHVAKKAAQHLLARATRRGDRRRRTGPYRNSSPERSLCGRHYRSRSVRDCPGAGQRVRRSSRHQGR